MKMINCIIDWYRDWKQSRDFYRFVKWKHSVIKHHCHSIADKYSHFAYLIPVDYTKFFKKHGIDLNDRALPYFWPARSIATTCVWGIDRVSWDPVIAGVVQSPLWGEDKIYVACNDPNDALMIAMLFG